MGGRVAVSPDGRWVVCDSGRTWCLWDLPGRRCVRTVDAPELIREANFLSGGDLVTLDWGGSVRRYRIEPPTNAPMMVALPHRAAEVAMPGAEVEVALADASDHLDAGRIRDALAAARRARAVPGFARAPEVLAVWERLSTMARRSGVRAIWPLESWGPVKASSGMAVDPRRRFVATADEERTVTLWSLASSAHERLRDLRFDEQELVARSLAVSDDGRWLAVGTYGQLHLFDLDGEEHRVIPLGGYVKCVSFSPRGVLVAATYEDGNIDVRRLDDLSRVCTVRGPEGWVYALTFDESRARDGLPALVAGDYDGHILFWDLGQASRYAISPEPIEPRPTAEPAEAVLADVGEPAVAGRHRVRRLSVHEGLVYAASGGLRVIDPRTGESRVHMTDQGAIPFSLDLDFDGGLAIVGCTDHAVLLADLATGECLARIEGHTHTIWGVASLGPHHLLTIADDGLVRRFYVDWDLALPDDSAGA